MRYGSRAKIDANQPAIVAGLRQAGCSVLSLAAVGHGCPDLAVGRLGSIYFLEVKDPTKPSSDQRLTPAQEKFVAEWRGNYRVVRTLEEALVAVGVRNADGTIRVSKAGQHLLEKNP